MRTRLLCCYTAAPPSAEAAPAQAQPAAGPRATAVRYRTPPSTHLHLHIARVLFFFFFFSTTDTTTFPFRNNMELWGTWICSMATMLKCNCPWLNSSNKVKERKKGKGGATTLAWREGEWSDIKHSVLTDCHPRPNSDHNDHDNNKSHYSNVNPRVAVFSSVLTIQSICPHTPLGGTKSSSACKSAARG